MYPVSGRSSEANLASVDICGRILGVPDTQILYPADRTQALAMALAPGDLYFTPQTGDQQIDMRHRSLATQVGGSLGISTLFKTRYRQLIPEEGLAESELIKAANKNLPNLDDANRNYVWEVVASELVQLLLRNTRLLDAVRLTPGALSVEVASRARELVMPRAAHIPMPIGNPSRVLEWGAGVRTGIQRINEMGNRMWHEAVILHSSPFASRVNAGIAAGLSVENTYCIEDENTTVLEQLTTIPQYQQGFEAAIVDNDLPSMDDDTQRAAISHIHELLIPKGLFVVRGFNTVSHDKTPAFSLIDKVSDGFTVLGKYTLNITRMDGVSYPANAAIFAKA